MSAEYLVVALDRRRDTGEVVDRLENAFGGREMAHRLPAAEVVLDLAVMRARLLEQTDRCRRDVPHFRARQHAAQLRERPLLEIGAARILGGQMRFGP